MADANRTIIVNVKANIDRSLRDANKVFDSTKKSAKEFADTQSKSLSSIQKEFSNLADPLSDIKSELLKGFGEIDFSKIGVSVKSLTSSFSSLSSTLIPLGAGLAAIAVSFFGVQSALRNITAIPIGNSFKNLTADIGGFDAVLGKLRVSSQGTINDTELMKATNLALAGSTGELKETFGNALPKLLEIASVQASATGQSVDHLFESLVTGIKRSSPMLIDNTGLVLSIGEANQAYADSIGKTVEQLTDQEKQIALINATLEAGSTAIDAAGGATLTNATRLAQIKTLLENLDGAFAAAFDPLLTVILDLGKGILTFVSKILTPFFAAFEMVNILIRDVAAALGVALLPVWSAFSGILSYVTEIIKSALPFIQLLGQLIIGIGKAIGFILSPLILVGDTFQFLANIVKEVTTVFSDINSAISIITDTLGQSLSNLLSPITQFRDRINETFSQVIVIFKHYAQQFLIGAFRVGGAILAGLTRPFPAIIKAVADLANAIGDFLIGNSPPPRGALSKIDSGGANVMSAWLDGFSSVSLAPIETITENVNKQLGEIGSYSLSQVESRLAQLDKALLPFQEQVTILKSNLDAIKQPVESALSALDSQQEKLIESFNSGNGAVLESLRLIDKQKEAINSSYEAEKDRLAQSEFQLALMNAAQAKERALLNIQKNRLGTERQLSSISQKQVSPPSDAKASASKTTKPSSAGGASSIDLPETSSQSMGAMTEFGTELADTFLSSFNETSAQLDMQTQIDRLKGGGSKITEGISALPERLTNAFAGIPNSIQELFSPLIAFFTDSRTEGTLAYTFANWHLRLMVWFETAKVRVSTFLTNTKDLFILWGTEIFSDSGFLTSAFSEFFGEGGTISAILVNAENLFQTFFDNVFGVGGVFSFISASLSSLLVSPISTSFNTIIKFINDLIQRVENAVNNLVNEAMQLRENLPQAIASRLPQINRIDIPDIPPLGAATGGVFTGGTLRVGERGEEIITSAEKMAVFPNNFVTAIESLTNVLRNDLVPDLSASSRINNGGVINNSNSVFSPTINTSNSADVSLRELQALAN